MPIKKEIVRRLAALARPSRRWSLGGPASDMAEVTEAELDSVRERLAAVRGRVPADRTLVAVSKLKPAELMVCAYEAGQRDFGENYVQELVDKGPRLPADARLHFIGHLQTNKVKLLLSEPRLCCVHTVDSLKLAAELQKRAAALRPGQAPLAVMAQVNTSGEASKGGCAPAECVALCEGRRRQPVPPPLRTAAPHCARVEIGIRASCPALRLTGLMCIGKYSAAEGGSAADFETLRRCRSEAAAALGEEEGALHLSMGMSHDFEEAIAAGATHVRVGSTIFGARPPKPPPAAQPPEGQPPP